MKTLEEKKDAIEWLMEYTGTDDHSCCFFNIKIILELLIEFNIIKGYDSKELNKLMFEDGNK